jgi:ankyrin repeat protein
MEAVDKLIERDTDPCRIVSGYSILSYAVTTGNRETVMHVLPICAGHKDRNAHLSMALFEAASSGYCGILLELVAALSSETVAEVGGPAIITAVLKDRGDIEEALLDHGVPVTVHDDHGITLLMTAAIANSPKTVAVLIRRGADPLAYDAEARNALGLAAAKGSAKALDALIAAGVDVNAHQQPCGNTALHYATSLREYDVIRTLIAHGASPHIANCDGQDCFAIARKHGFDDVVPLLQEARQ